MSRSPVSVALVDDSRVVRSVLRVLFEEIPDIEIIAEGEHGREAVSIIREHAPDVLILDIEMPVMTGIEALQELRDVRHDTEIIILSTLTEKYAPIALKALSLGASTYIEKPTTMGDGRSAEEIRDELVKLIRSFGSSDQQRAPRPAADPADTSPQRSPKKSAEVIAKQEFEVICIASSTGGPEALASLVSQLDGTFSIPIVIVQHMPTAFLPHLAKRLGKCTPMRVKIASAGERVEPGTIYIAPGEIHTTLVQRFNKPAVALEDSDPEVFCKPSANPLFRSAATLFAEKALCIVLTGMGEDGLAGAEFAVDRDATVIAQDEASATIWGMPYHVVKHDLHSIELPLGEIAPLLNQLPAPISAS